MGHPTHWQLSRQLLLGSLGGLICKVKESIMSAQPIVKCTAVSKRFCRDLRKSLWYGVCDSLSQLLTGWNKSTGSSDRTAAKISLRDGEFWAIRDLTFELHPGECLGLIGRNGAGKTTLLKMLTGIIRPDAGEIVIRGRVGALIALGAGFNPVLTGRENIYINGSILGMSLSEIDAAIPEIVDFTELSHAIDAPIRTYSSGMQVRLGFAIATCVSPDVLIVDEVLAVGDADFRLKCMKRMRKSLSSGSAVILVSHNMTDIRNLATTAIWLDGGRVRLQGDAHAVITDYLGTAAGQASSVSWEALEKAPGGKTVRLLHITVKPRPGHERITISSGGVIGVVFVCDDAELTLGFTVEVSTEEQVIVFHTGGCISPNRSGIRGRYAVDIHLPGFLLNSGKYFLSVTIDESQSVALAQVINAVAFEVGRESLGVNETQLPGVVSPRLHWELREKVEA